MATGLIQDTMGRPDAEGGELTPEAVGKNIKMPPELQTAYDRVVIAGMKVLFSKESHQLMIKQLDGEGSTGEKLGKGVAGLLLLLFKESNGSMPPQVLVPAGIQLVAQAADFLRKSGLAKVTNKDIGDGTELMISILLEKFGVSPEKMQQMFAQYSNENVNAAAPAAQASAQPQPPAGV